jgi:hypothetical protein
MEAKLKQLTEQEVTQKVREIVEQFDKEGERKMRKMAITALKNNLNVQFWDTTYQEYRKEADAMIDTLKDKLFWAKGEHPSPKELDEIEAKLYNWIVGELQNEFDKNLIERLVNYFKKHFYADDKGSNYNFKAMEEAKISEVYVVPA